MTLTRHIKEPTIHTGITQCLAKLFTPMNNFWTCYFLLGQPQTSMFFYWIFIWWTQNGKKKGKQEFVFQHFSFETLKNPVWTTEVKKFVVAKRQNLKKFEMCKHFWKLCEWQVSQIKLLIWHVSSLFSLHVTEVYSCKIKGKTSLF